MTHSHELAISARMAEVINLRQARKARERAEDKRQADANRAKHGRTKAEKNLADAARKKLDQVVEGARREPAED